MPTYQELLAEQIELTKRIAEARTLERRSALKRIHGLIAEFELEQSEVFGRALRPGGRPRAPAKYRDPVSGVTWSGRGRQPTWIRGRDRTAFLILPES